jgi:PAS domain S-box-containing protein
MIRLRLKPKLPNARVVLAGYSVIAIALAKAAVAWRSDLFLFFVFIPVIFAMVAAFPRMVVLAMQLIGMAASFWALQALKMETGSYVTLSALSAIMLTSIAALHRLRESRESSERALEKSERRLRSILEANPDCVQLIAADGTLQEMNPAGLAMVEAKSLDEVRERSIYSAVIPEHQEAFQKHLQLVFEGNSETLEFQIVGLKGTRRWLQTRSVPFRSETGEITAVLGVAQDITERKRAEKRGTVFSDLGHRLSGATTPPDAARIIADAALELLGWDACTLDLYGSEQGSHRAILEMDTIKGQRVEIQPACQGVEPSPFTKKVLAEGAKLISRQAPSDLGEGLLRFGDTARPSAALMFVPIRNGVRVIGVLSIQSYTHGAYNQGDLITLQALADHCGGALERLRAEQAFHESQQRFRTLIENSSDGIVLFDVKGTVLYSSPAITRMLGYSAQEVVGKTIFSQVHEEDLAPATRHLKELVNEPGATFSTQLRRQHKNGSWVWVEANVTNLLNEPGVRAIALNYRDITQRKKAEARVSIFSNLAQKLSAAATPKDAAKIILDAAQHLFGWDAGFLHLYSSEANAIVPILTMDLIGGQRLEVPPASIGTKLTPMSRRVLHEGPQLILREEESEARRDLKMIGDEARRSASLMFVPITDGGKAVGVLSIQSYLRRAYGQEDLRTLQALADHCGGALERLRAVEELRRSEERLRHSQKMEAVGQLSAGIAHDFNNILTIIQGHINLLLVESKLDPEAREAMEQIVLGAERAANLTAQLLAFSRKRMMQASPVDLSEIVANASTMLRGLLSESIELQFTRSGEVPPIHADVGMIEQVIVNLGLNARDAMPAGGKLIINLTAVDLDAMIVYQNPEARAGSFVCMAITDTGCGMDAETLGRIFEPFFTTKEVGKGTGLGLATVYGIVKQHQGWIEVESRIGMGTTLRVYLPASVQIPKPAVPSAAVLKAAGGTETILVVEDEPALRGLVGKILGRYGYRVVMAANGPEALQRWHEQADQIDLLLTDLVMPEQPSGMELAKRLKAECPRLKVIYSSGYSLDLQAQNPVLQEGFNFLSKPYNPSTLAATVRKRLDAKDD